MTGSKWLSAVLIDVLAVWAAAGTVWAQEEAASHQACFPSVL
ncbi:MAG TPA: hypothetical protein VLU25_03730 [Acidobacteriota bacterium]|nr:hypothetical protein [Acidobacteriota bacterium]